MPRYLNPSALVAVKYLAAERIRWQRPHRASRVRGFLVGRHRRPSPAVLYRALAGLQQMEVAAA